MSEQFGLHRLLRYAMAHPIGRRQRLRTLGRIASWQLRSRFHSEPIVCDWIGGARLLARHGMTGATGNLYFGLHEFADMAFILHLLRPGDLFVDVGANIGSYSVLAAKLSGARVAAFEPDHCTMDILRSNIELNGIEDRVALHEQALSHAEHDLWFSTGMGTENHVLPAREPGSILLHGTTLDRVLGGDVPIAIKVDVEGYEPSVLAGAAATLAAPGLRAIEVETVTPDMERIFADHGFVLRYYDPFTRGLADAPASMANNSLYVRDEAFVTERLRSAPAVDVHGINL
ncbi:MAG TPA: FkbM family methyltransferase [Sphingopyxis sp.]|nr:FkbM family methyltransferase [Sphingopyxis sp.]HMP44149.1 FkbM family methyltransferase [Sphingopyxis sp.]HMQ19988.1 FkbM family methyltransferase [Sphingopyxis sp.]